MLRFAAVCAGAWVFAALFSSSRSFVPPPAGPSSGPAAALSSAPAAPVGLLPDGLVQGPPAELQLATLASSSVLAGLAGLGLGSGLAPGSLGPVSAALSTADLTPETFRPVCPASDGLYNLGKGLADTLLGAEGMEYRPLAIEALLRVRLEICVLESFVYEAIVPFVQKKGLGWILPLHETIDTVIAGTVFAVALNFILFGTTKILAVLSIYHDFLLGAPLRLVGFAILPEKKVKEDPPLIQINWPGFTPKDEPEEAENEQEREPPPVPLQVLGSACKGYGVFAGILKNILEGFDTFVGRYLAVTSIAYIGFKWAHWRLFNDFPPL